MTVFNRAAADLLRRGDGLSVDREAATAAAARDPDTSALRRAVVGACATGAMERHEGGGGFHPGSALLARPSGRRPLQVTVAPLRLRVPILAGAPPRRWSWSPTRMRARSRSRTSGAGSLD